MFEYKEEYRHPTSVCLNVTDECPCRCRYCFTQQKPHYMSYQVAKDGLDWLMANVKWKEERGFKENPSLTFFGGEPTLMWDEIIVPLTKYIRDTYDEDFNLTITTNGVLLNEERIKFLKENEIFPLLSIDGIPEVQNFNRPMADGSPSFPRLKKVIPILLENFPNTTFRATSYQPTVDKTYESYCFAESLGFRNIFLCPNARNPWSKQELETLETEWHKIFLRRIFQYFHGIEPMGSSQIDKVFSLIYKCDLNKLIPNYTNFKKKRSPFRCGLGTTSCSIGFDGSIYSCQEQNTRDTNDYFYIGDIYSGIIKQKHSIVLDDYAQNTVLICAEDETICNNCLIREGCINSMCPSVSHDLYNSFFKRPKVDCVLEKTLVNGAIYTMKILLEQEENKYFKEYFEQLLKKEGME